MYINLRQIQTLLSKLSPKLARILGKVYVKTLFRPSTKLLGIAAVNGISFRSNERGLMQLRGRYAGQRIFIIGNGPSLKLSDLNKLKNELTIATNKIYICFSETNWRPTFYCSEDPLMITKLDYLKTVLPNNLIKLLPSKPGIAQRLPNTLTFLLTKKRFYDVPELPKFSDNALLGLYWGSTVTYTCVQLACHMGINEIYLLGVDLDYKVHKDHETGDTVHVADGSHINHFHPDYDKSGEKYFPPNLDRHKLAFDAVSKVAQQTDLKVFNASRGGKLELFPRVDLDEVLAHKIN